MPTPRSRPSSRSPRFPQAPRTSPANRSARIGLALLLLALGLGLTACGSTSSGGSGQGGVKVTDTSPAAEGELEEVQWGLNAEPTTLDPIYSYFFYDDQVLANTCETLYRLNPDLTRSPELATAAERTSPTTWVYQIRKGVKFWDGNPLTAEDVAYSLARNLDPGSYFNTFYSRVKDIRATGKYEVTVQLKQPDSLFNQELPVTGSAVIEKAWAEKEGKKLGTPEGGLMCSGPYELSSWTKGSHITLTRNPNFWDKSNAPLTKKIVFRFIPDTTAQTEALVSGGLDGMFLIDPAGVPRLETSEGHVYYGPNMFVNYLIPTKHPSPLSDVRVRKALALIIDRPAISETIYHGAAEPMRTLGTPTIWGTDKQIRAIYEPEWKAMKMYATPDIEAAKKLFQQAGSPQDSITLAFPTGGAEQQIAEAVQSSAEQIGMKIDLKAYTYTALTNLFFEPDALEREGIDLLYGPFDVNTTDTLGVYHVFLPSAHSIYNYAGYDNPEVGDLLEKAMVTYDDVQRAKLVAAAEKIVMDDMPFIPLVAPKVMAYLKQGVTGTPTSYSVYWSSWANQLGAGGEGEH
jgi:peptide/nickel transport system substrate-binding protein